MPTFLSRAAALARSPLCWVFAAYCLSRLVAHQAGVRFDMYFTPSLAHFADYDLLRTRWWEVLLYTHAQPPMLNVLLGAALQAFPGQEARALHGLYLGLGLLFAGSLYSLLASLRVGPKTSAALSVLFLVSPAAILYENFFFYTHPTAALLCASAALLARYAATARTRDGLALFALLALVCLTRTVFHLAWLLAVVGAVAWHFRGDRRLLRRTLLAAALPAAIVFALFAKNQVLFGTFASSSWLGMNLARVAIESVPPAERRAMHARGEVSALALQPPFDALDAYPPVYAKVAPTGRPVLDVPTRNGGRHVNLNHAAYLGISKQYMRDSVVMLRTHPEAYARGVANAFGIALYPASDYMFLRGNLARIEGYEAGYSRWLLGRNLPPGSTPSGMFQNSRAHAERMGHVLWGLPVLLLVGVWLAWRAARHGRHTEALVLGFVALTVAYVLAVGNLLEVTENNRFRYMVDAYLVVLLGVTLASAQRAWRRLRRAPSASQPSSAAIESPDSARP